MTTTGINDWIEWIIQLPSLTSKKQSLAGKSKAQILHCTSAIVQPRAGGVATKLTQNNIRMQADRISEGVREDVQKSAVSALVKEHTSKEHQGLVVSEVASACASPFRITKARCCTSLRERAPTALVTLFC